MSGAFGKHPTVSIPHRASGNDHPAATWDWRPPTRYRTLPRISKCRCPCMDWRTYANGLGVQPTPTEVCSLVPPIAAVSTWWNAKVTVGRGGESWCGNFGTRIMTFVSFRGRSLIVVAVLSRKAHEATDTGPEGVTAHWCRAFKSGQGPECPAVSNLQPSPFVL